MKISVVVPIYNMEKFITRALSYLRVQESSNLEFLLINDGSTDNTLNIMQQISADDNRFSIFTMENKGYGHACNFGIKQASGDFIAIYEPDDCIAPDFYSCLWQAARRYGQADVIRYNGMYCRENGQVRTVYHWKKSFTERILDKYALKRFWRSHPSVFNGIYRKNFILEKSVFFCETPSASFQDAMFMVSLFYANPSIYIINDVKYTYIMHNMQSIKFVDDKVEFVIRAWEMEADWLSSNGIRDYDFFLYRLFTQMNSLQKRVSPENRDQLIRKFKQLNKGKIYLACDIPTITQKIKYALA